MLVPKSIQGFLTFQSQFVHPILDEPFQAVQAVLGLFLCLGTTTLTFLQGLVLPLQDEVPSPGKSIFHPTASRNLLEFLPDKGNLGLCNGLRLEILYVIR